MNVVLTFSASNQSLKLANYFASILSWDSYDLTSFDNQTKFDYHKEYDYVMFTFPVYSQSITPPVKEILKKLKGKYFVLLATYGKMGTGNILYEAQRIIQGKLIGAAYVPSKHTYIDNGEFREFQKLNKLIENLNLSKEVKLPKRKKHIFANLAPNLRARMNVKLKTNEKCIKCNHCNHICPTKAIYKGRINKDCLRCLKCFNECPVNGLDVKYSYFLKTYLKKDKETSLIIY